MILIVTQCFPPDRGGIEVLMGGLARELAAGTSVTVLADRIRGGATEPALTGIALRRFGGLKPLRRWRKARAVRNVAAGAAAILCDSWKSAALLPPDGPPAVALAHGAELAGLATGERGGRIRDAFSRVGTVVANSAFTAGLLPGLIDARHRVLVIHPPIDRPAEAAAQPHAAGPTLLTVARLEPRKGIDMVLRALPALVTRHPALRYDVVGDGADRPRLERLAAELGVAARTVFHGAVDDAAKAQRYAGATLFAMPVRREGASVEGFGIVYREAAWFGLPSVAGTAGGAAEAVRDGVTGVVCDGADPAAVTAALGRLLDDPALRARLGAAAAAAVRAEGTWAATIGRYRAALGFG